MKRCAACGRDIPESATVCEQCETWAAVHVAAPASPAKAPSRPPDPGVPRRELLVIVLAIAGAAIITFGLLLARGGPSSAVAAATVAPAPRAALPEPPAASQTWNVERRAYWTANQRHSDAFELAAENSVPIWMNQVRPLLVVRCISNRTEVFVFTGSALKIEPDTEDHTVTYGFDDEPERSERWPDSAEHDALFAPVGAAIAQRVLNAHRLRFGYTPHNAAPVVAQFSVTGLRELFEPVAKDCGWKK